MTQGHPHETADCRAISKILQRVGDKWTVLVVSLLGGSPAPLRFTELRAGVGGISQKMLTSTLRSLEMDGFVTRTVYPTIPPKVEYALTDLGRELLVPVAGLVDWARANSGRINTARARWEEKTGEAAQ